MTTNESLTSISKFIAGYSAHLMGAGVHTSRVIRNSKRIGEAYGVDVKLSVFHKNIILTIIDNETREACNEVIDIPPHPISFEHNSELSALSWEVYDKHLSLHELSDKFNKIISAPKIDPLFVLLLVGFANASFCKLFGGDGHCLFGYHHRTFPEATDAEEENQSLYYFHCFRFCCVALCIDGTDF